MGDKRFKMEVQRVKLPHHEGQTLQDQDDVIIWRKVQILLQAVDECTAEFGSAAEHEGVAEVARQLRVVTQEAVRRDMFGRRVRHGEPTDGHLLSWHELLKQLLEGEGRGDWEKTEGTDRQYTEVVLALKRRGIQLPAQRVTLDPLRAAGELTKTKERETDDA